MWRKEEKKGDMKEREELETREGRKKNIFPNNNN